MTSKQIPFVVIVICWLLVMAFALSRVAWAPSVDADTAAADPAFQQTLSHLTQIARQKHPVGSAAHDSVRDYIIEQVAALGLDVETQAVPVEELTGDAQWAAGATISNIITRIRGREQGKALLVTSHYDSVPDSYGAGDASAAVASMLTLLSGLTHDQFRNDIIFLFSDAEEPCLCGARAFATGHPWIADVGIVLNFEARGTAGPSLMFETSAGNGALVREFAAAAQRPVTSSLYYEIYRVLPNNTDLTVYKVAGIPGLNFAFIDGFRHYHTETDTLETLDKNTLFHHYTNIATMVRQFADADLGNLQSGDVVYFDVLSWFVVSYPPVVAAVISLLCAALFVPLLIPHLRTSARWRAVRLLGSLVLLLSFLTGAAWVLALLNIAALPNLDAAEIRQVTTSKVRMLVLALLTMAAFGVALWLARKIFTRMELVLPILALWLAALFTILLWMPGASYILMWPLLFILLGIHLERYCAEKRVPAWYGHLARVVLPLPLLIIWTQLVYAVFLALTLEDSLIISAAALFGLSLLAFYLVPVGSRNTANSRS